MKFSILGSDIEQALPESSISISDSDDVLTIEVWDIFGDHTVISLSGQNRDEFINKISELKREEATV